MKINTAEVVKTLAGANGLALASSAGGQPPTFNREKVLESALDRVRYAAARPSVKQPLTLKPGSEYRVSDIQITSAVAVHLKGGKPSSPNACRPSARPRLAFRARSFEESVKVKDGFENMVHPDCDGIGAFGTLYPAPEAMRSWRGLLVV